MPLPDARARERRAMCRGAGVFVMALSAALSVVLSAADALASSPPCGRWQGVIEIAQAPPQRVVIDLARAGPGGWIGSVILPGRGVKGAPLRELKVDDDGFVAGLGAAFPFPIEPAPRLEARWQGDGGLVGRWFQGGHSAPLRLACSGEAQVDPEPQGTAIAQAMEGAWTGRYELGGVPREVTLVLRNGAQGRAAGELKIVGKRTSQLHVDRVVQGRGFITLEASEAGLRIEGRFDAEAGRIDGGVAQGPFEAPLVLRRQAAGG